MRANRRPETLAAEDDHRLHRFLAWLPERPGVLATYASVPGEPDTSSLIDAAVARGWDVLVPVIRKEVDWARFEGWASMREGWQGIPTPSGHRLGAEALLGADVVVTSCLLVDRSGYRLGVGGGWYDRALLHRRLDATVLAWSRDAEVVDQMPREPHDVRVDGYVTESGVHLL